MEDRIVRKCGMGCELHGLLLTHSALQEAFCCCGRVIVLWLDFRDRWPGSFVVSAIVLDLDLNQEWLLSSVYAQMITNCK